ncbi:MAG: DUF899 domain-containing protein [Planctomycetes bacterium]|jgi:predicted dithiol-disulfide oxidoreductase (DUF899 family)|nr:DUF899 domain-containing protein [Planctomycetota bacterium]
MAKSTMDERIAAAERRVEDARKKLADLRRGRPPEEFGDFPLLAGARKPVRLADLFGARPDLIVVHNMGAGCPYCTLWADGFNGILPHLESRAAFAVVSPDPPAAQKRFAARRGWKFRMVSDREGTFTKRAGFVDADGSPWPGVSAFRLAEDGLILRTGSAPFGPGDPFCPAYHLFGLLDGGPAGWQPRFRY